MTLPLSVYLVVAGQPLTIEFPFDSVDKVKAAVTAWMAGSQVITWSMLDAAGHGFVLVVNYGLVVNAMITTVGPEDDEGSDVQPVPLVRAALEGGPERWDIRQLHDGEPTI